MNLTKIFKKIIGTRATIRGSLHFRNKDEWETFKETFKDCVVQWYINGEDDPRESTLYEVYEFQLEQLHFTAFGPSCPNPQYNPKSNILECPKCHAFFDRSELMNSRHSRPFPQNIRKGPLAEGE